MRNAEIRTKGLWWADFVMQSSFFVMQKYLTDVWGLSFTTAATALNIWDGISRILPISFLFLADILLGNFTTLLLSTILSTTGLVLITWITRAGYRCENKANDEEECVGRNGKAVFITAMIFIALGRAARFSSAKPFRHDQTGTHDDHDDDDDDDWSWSWWWSQISDIVSTLSLPLSVICFIVFFDMPAAAFFAFPLVKKWYLLFGVSAVCTVFATILYLSSFKQYKIHLGPRSDGSAITDFARVFVAAALNRSSLPSDSNSSPNLHVTAEDEEFKDLSTSRFLGFLNKAAMKSDENGKEKEEKKKRSWRLCSVSEVESTKITIRMVPVYMTFLMCGVVLSMGNTYLVEQATHMNYHIGGWKPPLQLLHLFFSGVKLVTLKAFYTALVNDDDDDDSDPDILIAGMCPTFYSIVCCAVAAAVERRRFHAIRGHHHDEDGEVHMGAYWLLIQVGLMGLVEAWLRYDLACFHEREAPKSTERYHNCFGEGVIGVGFMCGALSVYVIGKISESGAGKNWFQHSLNRSRLDRYYWVLAVLTSLNLIVGFFVLSNYTTKMTLLSRATGDISQPARPEMVQEMARPEMVQEMARPENIEQTASAPTRRRRRRRTRRSRRWGHMFNDNCIKLFV